MAAPKHHSYTVTVDGETFSDNLGWLHEQQHEDGDEIPLEMPTKAAPHNILFDKPKPSPKPSRKVVEKELTSSQKRTLRAKANKALALMQLQHLKQDMPWDGYDITPADRLPLAVRRGRARSISAAMLKRLQREPMTDAEANVFERRGTISKQQFYTLTRDPVTGAFDHYRPKMKARWYR